MHCHSLLTWLNYFETHWQKGSAGQRVCMCQLDESLDDLDEIMKILSRYISTSRMSSRINTLRFHLLRIHLAVNTSIKGTREQVPQNLYTRELHIDSFKNFSKWLTAVHEYSRPYNKRSWSMKTTLSISGRARFMPSHLMLQTHLKVSTCRGGDIAIIMISQAWEKRKWAYHSW